MAKLLWLSVLAAIVGFIRSHPGGPPPRESVCTDVIPDRNSPHQKQPTNGNYFINTNLIFRGQFYEYTAGNTYTVEVKSTSGFSFRGFIVQAWAPDNAKIGEFVPQSSQQQLIDCHQHAVPPERTIGHKNTARVDFTSQLLIWRAPESGVGLVDFMFTVVRIQSEFFGSISAAAEQAKSATASTRKFPITTDAVALPITTDAALDTETTKTDALTGVVTMTDSPTSRVTMTDAPTREVTVTDAPTREVTMTDAPTREVTMTDAPTSIVTDAPTSVVTMTDSPTSRVTMTDAPTREVTMTDAPTSIVTDAPTSVVTMTDDPTSIVTDAPTSIVTDAPTSVVTDAPTSIVTDAPTSIVTDAPTSVVTMTDDPTSIVTDAPTSIVTDAPTSIVTDAPTSVVTMTDAPTSAVNVTNTSTSVGPETITDPDRDPEDYRITARFPNDCAVSECSVFVGIDTNTGESTYLDVYMEGQAQAWVAVGFTKSPNMFSADVLACNVNPNTSMVEALDTWNDERVRYNTVNGIQSTYLRNGTFTNGRIQCTIVRKIAGSDSIRDLNLDGFYYLLYGIGMIQNAGFLLHHEFGIDEIPQVSTSLISPTLGQVNFGGSSDYVNPQDSFSIKTSEVSTFFQDTELAQKDKVMTTSASWLMVSILCLYSWALRI